MSSTTTMTNPVEIRKPLSRTRSTYSRRVTLPMLRRMPPPLVSGTDDLPEQLGQGRLDPAEGADGAGAAGGVEDELVVHAVREREQHPAAAVALAVAVAVAVAVACVPDLDAVEPLGPAVGGRVDRDPVQPVTPGGAQLADRARGDQPPAGDDRHRTAEPLDQLEPGAGADHP